MNLYLSTQIASRQNVQRQYNIKLIINCHNYYLITKSFTIVWKAIVCNVIDKSMLEFRTFQFISKIILLENVKCLLGLLGSDPKVTISFPGSDNKYY